MYSIEKKPYGIKFVLGGIINRSEMIAWHTQAVAALEQTGPEFGVLVDMRTLEPLSRPAQEEIDKVQRAYRKAGMTRSVVILSSPIVKRQFVEIARETGILKWERYIDASTTPDWEQVGIDWLEKEIDPELRQKDKNPA